MSWVVLPVAVAFMLLLLWLRRPGVGGAVGRAIRESDYAAWCDAVEVKRAELDELMRARPKR